MVKCCYHGNSWCWIIAWIAVFKRSALLEFWEVIGKVPFGEIK